MRPHVALLAALALVPLATASFTDHWVGVGQGPYYFNDYSQEVRCADLRIEIAVLWTPAGWEVAWHTGPGASFPILSCNSVSPGLFGPVSRNGELEGSPEDGFFAHRSNPNCPTIDTRIDPLGPATAMSVRVRCSTLHVDFDPVIRFERV